METKTMSSRKAFAFLVATLALTLLLVSAVSAQGQITSVEVNGVEAINGANIASFAGQMLPVKVIFTANGDETDVRVKAWIAGGNDYAVSTERFDIRGNTTESTAYSRFLSVKVPSNIDPTEDLKLEISVESRNGGLIDSKTINLAGQRESYNVEILDVNSDSKVSAGDNLALDVVLKNRGSHDAEDTFVSARIPALGIEQKAFFGDLSPVDQANPDKFDSDVRRMFLKVPANAPAGVYDVQIEAYNADSTTSVTRKVAVVGASEDSMVVPSSTTKNFAAGEKATYTLTLVNSGDRVRVYELILDAPTGLTVDTEQNVVAIPAGSSRDVKITAMASKAGVYSFGVNVNSDNLLVKTQTFTAKVDGTSSSSSVIAGTNATVLLTVILAIVFVVLLVVLIVLLTRKPAKSEEFGESYY